MKYSILLLLFVFSSTLLTGQVLHSTIGEGISWKSRKSFDVMVYFQQDVEKNIKLFVTTTEQNTRFIMEPSDQIIFVNNSGEKKTFSFSKDSNRGTAGTKTTYANAVKLNLDDVAWLSKTEIKQVQYINMAEMIPHSYNLTADEKIKFKQVVAAFQSQIKGESPNFGMANTPSNASTNPKGGNMTQPGSSVPAKVTTTNANCTKYIKDGKGSSLVSYPLVLVTKGDFHCKMQFEVSKEKVITALVTTTDSYASFLMKKDDRLMFISSTRAMRHCPFLTATKKTSENAGDVINYEATLKLSLEDLAWLGNNKVIEIRFMNMKESKMQGHSLTSSGSADLKEATACILNQLDPTNASIESLKTNKQPEINDVGWEKVTPNTVTTTSNNIDAAPNTTGKIWSFDDLLLDSEAAEKKYTALLEKELQSIDDQNLRNITLNFKLGQIFFEQKQYAIAVPYLKKSLKGILDANTGTDKKPKIESMLATIYLNHEYYEAAARDNSTALGTWKNGVTEGEDLNFAFEAYLNQGKILKNLEANDANVTWYAQAVTEGQKNWAEELKKRSLAPIVHRSNPEKSTDFNLALLSFKNAQDLVVKFDKNLLTAKQIELQLELGALYFEAGDSKNAKKHYLAALNLMNTKHPQLAITNSILGEICLMEQSYQEATTYMEQAQKVVLGNAGTLSPSLVQNIDKMAAPLDLVHAITSKGVLSYQKNKNNPSESDLQKTLQDYDIASKLLLEMRKTHRNEGSSDNLENATDKLSQQGVLICHKLYEKTKKEEYLEQAFYYAELTKSGVLYEVAHDLTAALDVPKKLITKENGLRVQIAHLKNDIATEAQKGKTQDAERLKNLEDKLTSLRQEHRKLLQEIEQKHPTYYAMKLNDKSLKIKDLQASLKSNEVFLQYVAADSFIYVLAISGTEVKSQLNMLSEPLFYTVKKLQIALKKNKADYYENKGLEIYKNAIGGLVPFIKDKKLIIALDAELHYIPFEILPTQKTDSQGDTKVYSKTHFFVRDHAICYTHSAQAYLLSKIKRHSNSNGQIATWAPSFESMTDILRQKGIGESLDPLPGAKKEAEEIAYFFGNTAFIAGEASEAQFKNLASSYSILHIATHGILNDYDPLSSSLVLTNEDKEDGLLTAAELYNMRLNADLAVLSACNSGMGKLSKSEGVIGVASGFSFAGVPNIVMSKWPVSDYSTEILMKEFYKNLQAGMPKDEALQLAKIKYLDDNKEKDKMLAPFFWGGFVLNGNTEAIGVLEGGGSNYWVYGGIGVLLVLGGGMLWRRKKN